MCYFHFSYHYDSESDSESEGDGDSDEDDDEEDPEENKENDLCPICLGEFQGQMIGIPENCKHVFCADCIQEWTQSKIVNQTT